MWHTIINHFTKLGKVQINMYRRGEAQGGMPVFEQPRGHRTRASNDPDADYFEL